MEWATRKCIVTTIANIPSIITSDSKLLRLHRASNCSPFLTLDVPIGSDWCPLNTGSMTDLCWFSLLWGDSMTYTVPELSWFSLLWGELYDIYHTRDGLYYPDSVGNMRDRIIMIQSVMSLIKYDGSYRTGLSWFSLLGERYIPHQSKNAVCIRPNTFGTSFCWWVSKLVNVIIMWRHCQ